MQITEVKVFPVEEEKLKAFVSVVLDDCFMVNDIKIIQGRESRFISMPSRRRKSGQFKDVAHPLNNETRRMMEDRILAEYDRVRLGSDGASRVEPPRQARPEASEPAVAGQAEPSEDKNEKTLEEIAEEHLSDSFWSS